MLFFLMLAGVLESIALGVLLTSCMLSSTLVVHIGVVIAWCGAWCLIFGACAPLIEGMREEVEYYILEKKFRKNHKI